MTRNNFGFLALIATMLLFSAFMIKSSISWNIAEGYSIKFISKDPTGVFTKMTGDIIFDEQDLNGSSFDVKVDVSSINTGNGMKNKHAKSSKWFDVDKYPFIHFVSDKFSKTPAGYNVTGTMEIHGVKRPFDIPFTFTGHQFDASFTVNRTDFGIGEPGGKVPDVLEIEVSVPVTK